MLPANVFAVVRAIRSPCLSIMHPPLLPGLTAASTVTSHMAWSSSQAVTMPRVIFTLLVNPAARPTSGYPNTDTSAPIGGWS